MPSLRPRKFDATPARTEDDHDDSTEVSQTDSFSSGDARTTSPSRAADVQNEALPPVQFSQAYIRAPLHDLFGTPVQNDFECKMSCGFFKVNHDWICYRRNYITVSASLLSSGPKSMFMGRRGTQEIHQFAFSLSAVTVANPPRRVDLIQHTPKRDKGPQMDPKVISVSSPGFHAVWDRLQFKTATSNNGKKRGQQYFAIKVSLIGCLEPACAFPRSWINLADKYSEPMIVRGRSPGHYNDIDVSASLSPPSKTYSLLPFYNSGSAAFSDMELNLKGTQYHHEPMEHDYMDVSLHPIILSQGFVQHQDPDGIGRQFFFQPQDSTIKSNQFSYNYLSRNLSREALKPISIDMPTNGNDNSRNSIIQDSIAHIRDLTSARRRLPPLQCPDHAGKASRLPTYDEIVETRKLAAQNAPSIMTIKSREPAAEEMEAALSLAAISASHVSSNMPPSKQRPSTPEPIIARNQSLCSSGKEDNITATAQSRKRKTETVVTSPRRLRSRVL